MNATIGQEGRFAYRRVARSLVLLGLAAIATTPAADAAAIRSRSTGTVTAAWATDSYGSYFRNALQQRSLKVNVPVSLRSLRTLGDGTLPETAFVEYLRWRRSLNPLQFDRWHPSVARMILRDQEIRRLRETVVRVPQVVTPTPGTPGVLPSVIVKPVPPTVPEPSSVAIVGLLFAAAAWGRRWRQRQG